MLLLISQVGRTHQIYLDLPLPAKFQKLHLLSEFKCTGIAQPIHCAMLAMKLAMSTTEFFRNRKLWSERKHRLLEKYLRPFATKVAKTTKTREVFIVDGFAGRARYDDGSEGSPLLIAKFSNIANSWSDSVLLKLIDVEPDVETFRLLEESTKAWIERGVVVNINRTFQDALSDILRLIRNSPALFFLDPYGPTFIHFEDLTPILRRTAGATEIIVNFDADGLYRIARGALSTKTELKTAAAFADQVTKIIGSDSWLEIFENSSMDAAEGENYLLGKYLENMRGHMSFVFAYPIREALDKRPKYHFVFGTRHYDGVELMNDFVRHEDDLIFGEHIETTSPLFQNLDLGGQAIQARRGILRTIMSNYFKGEKLIVRSRMIPQLINAHFGKFDLKDYRSVFDEYVRSGKLITNDNTTGIDLRRFTFADEDQ